MASITKIVFARIVPGFFVVGGGLFLVIGIFTLYRGTKSADWPSVIGTVMESDVRRSTHRGSDGRASTSYSVRLSYEYDVDGGKYIGTRIRFGKMGHGKQADAKTEQLAYPKGRKVEVYYDPDDPAASVLIKGIGRGVWIPIVLGTVFFLLGLALMIYLPRVMDKQLTGLAT